MKFLSAFHPVTLIAAVLAALAASVAIGGTKVIHNGDTLVFMGDSITQYGKDSAAGYLPLVAKGLATNGVNVTWIGAGHAGDTAANMRARFQNDVISKHPQVVTILAGVNDCSQGWPNNASSSPNDVAAMADMAIAAGIKPVLCSPTGGGLESFPQAVEDYSAAVRQIAQQRNVPYGTTHEAFKAYVQNNVNPAIGATDKGYLIRATVDGLHMDIVGNRIIAVEILKALGFDSADELARAAAAWNEIPPFYQARVNVKITAGEFNSVRVAAANAGKTMTAYSRELFHHGIELLRTSPAEVSATGGADIDFSMTEQIGFVDYDALLAAGRALRANETGLTETGSLPRMINSALLAAVHALPAVSGDDLPEEPVQTVNTAAFTKSITLVCSGYTGNSTLKDFPVAVRLAAGSPEGFSYADMAHSATGGELRFADATGRSLAYEIERWDPAGTSLIWVKIPSLARGTAFTMYYGGTPADAVASRWTWAADYVGVWHMEENGGTVYEGVNGLDAEPRGNSASRQTAEPGVFGNARLNAVSGLNAYTGQALLEIQDSLLLDVGNDFTFSGWIKMSNEWPGNGRIVSRNRYVPGGSNIPDWELAIPNATTLNGYAGSKTAVTGTIPSALNSWVHVAGVFNGTTLTAYANGVQVFAETISPVQDSNNKLAFGSNDRDCFQGHFVGLFDEFRLRDAVSSADWVKAEYDQAGNAFLSVGGGNNPPAAPDKPAAGLYID